MRGGGGEREIEGVGEVGGREREVFWLRPQLASKSLLGERGGRNFHFHHSQYHIVIQAARP